MKRVWSDLLLPCLVLPVILLAPAGLFADPAGAIAATAAFGAGEYKYGSDATGRIPVETDKSAASYERKIDRIFNDLKNALAALEETGKKLEPVGREFLKKAEYGLKLRKQVASALDAMKSQAVANEDFQKTFHLLVERVDGFNSSLPTAGKKRPCDDATMRRNLANISAALESVTMTMSPAEQQAVVEKSREALQGDIKTFEKLLEREHANAVATVEAGRKFSRTVADFDKYDREVVQKFRDLKATIKNLEVANRVAKAPEALPQAVAGKLDAARNLFEQGAVVARRGADTIGRIVGLFNRRNKQVRANLLAAEKHVNAIYARHPGLFNTQRLNILIALLILSGAILYYILQAQKGTKLFIRRIAGLSALDDAVGRATEMGRPVLFVTGIKDVDDVQTLAGISILAGVASKTAEYDTELFVPCCMPLAYSMCQEVVRESYLRAGRPDAFKIDNIRYLTSDQFGFVAGVDGIMIREKVAATFYLGKFYAESLILAETGNSIGAIQIAGTAETAQLPFFVAACDYTLIGEELFAASAYLSGEPRLLGSLKGQDVGKAVMIIAIVVGMVVQILISYEYLPESLSVARLFVAS